MRSIIFMAAFVAVSMGTALAQVAAPTLNFQQFHGSNTIWLTPKQGVTIDEPDFFLQPGVSDILTAGDDMLLLKVRDGERGITHRHYHQFHCGYPVEGAVMITHAEDGQLKSANGILAQITFNEEPAITEEDAIMAVQIRLGVVPPVAWEDVDFTVPKTTLVYTPTTWETNGALLSFRLAYRVEITTLEPYSSSIVHVDAQTGEVFRIESAIQFCATGQAITMYNGSQSIQTKYHGWPNVRYNLFDDCRGEIRTRVDNRETEANSFRYFRKCDELWDDDNRWLSPEKHPVTSLHWAAEMYIDYLQAAHGRDGLDDNKIGIKLVYHRFILPVIANHNTGQLGIYNPPNNGYWDRVIKEGHFGCADGVKPMVSLDFVGHELTHGMINNEMQDLLTQTNEALALNESFADILGNCSETRALLNYDPAHLPNFTIFEEVINGPYRSLMDPMSLGAPRAYHGSGWDYGVNPDLQSNGSVQDYWYYLLSMGSAGRPTEGNVTVCGIGQTNAARIAYLSITNYLGVSSSFADARQASINAAEALFSPGSFEATQCANAWAAVGVGLGSNFCIPTAVTMMAEDLQGTVGLFPNPASTTLHVTMQLPAKATACAMSIWSVSGGKVMDFPLQATLQSGTQEWSADCRNLPSGTYQLLFSSNQAHICKRFIVTH
jgi:bacillolysin